MTDGDPWHNFDIDGASAPEQCSTDAAPVEYHAYFVTKDLNQGVRHATRICLDRAREAGNNPRKGTVTLLFEDNGVSARWTPIQGIRLPKEDS